MSSYYNALTVESGEDPGVFHISDQTSAAVVVKPEVAYEEPFGDPSCDDFVNFVSSTELVENVVLDVLPPEPLPVPPSILPSQAPGVSAAAGKFPSYQNMTKSEYLAEMHKSIHDIVTESLAQFGKDAREYHPFYLRIFKYICIGQKLGHVVPGEEEMLWKKYDQFAKSQFELSQKATIPMSGESSPYATYILTKKVIINGVQVEDQRKNDKGKQRKYRQLDKIVKDIRTEWSTGGERSIKDDLKTRQRFFEHCKDVTYPSECVKMNNLWTKLLAQEDSELSKPEPALEKAMETQVPKSRTSNRKKTDKKSESVVGEIAKSKKGRQTIAPPSTSALLSDLSQPSSSFGQGDNQENDVKCIKQDIYPERPETTKPFKISNRKRKLNIKREDIQKLHVTTKMKKSKGSVVMTNPNLLAKKKLKLTLSSMKKTQNSNKPFQARLEKILARKLSLPKAATLAKKNATSHQEKTSHIPHKRKSSTAPDDRDNLSTGKQKRKPSRKPLKGEQIKSRKVKNKSSKSGGLIPKIEIPLSTTSDCSLQEDTQIESDSELSVELSGNVHRTNKDLSCVCDICGSVVSHPNYLGTHKRRMHDPKNRTFCCPAPACSQLQLKDSRNLWYHYVRNHMKPEDVCPDIRDLPSGEVRRTSDANQYWPCEHCGKEFKPRACLLRHIRVAHVGIPKENYVRCPYCDRDFKEKATMAAHVRRFHEMTEIIRCDICNKGFGSTGRLWKHRVDDHGLSPEAEAEAAGIKYEQCAYCPEQLVKGKQVRNHIQTAHPEHYDAWWVQEQERRRERKAEEKRRSREKVKSEGVGPSWLIREKFKNKKGDKYCQECEKNIKGDLAKHMEQEHGIFPPGESVKDPEQWVCPREICRQKFATRRNLVSHMIEIHCDLEERIVAEKLVKFVEREGSYLKYQCNVCCSYLYDRGEVRVHIVAFHPDIFEKMKSGTPIPKPELICLHCPAKFTDDEALRNHVETTHPDLCWRCPECMKVVLTPEDLTEHFMTAHAEGEENAMAEEPAISDPLLSNPESSILMKTRIRYDCLISRRKREKRMSGEVSSEEKAEKEKHRRSVYSKFQQIRSDCPVCGKACSFSRIDNHLKTVHQLLENGNLWTCPVCGKNSFSRRETFLAHVELCHPGMVDMEQMIKICRLVNTHEDWRAMDLPMKRKRKNDKSKEGKIKIKQEPETTQTEKHLTAKVKKEKSSVKVKAKKVARKPAKQKGRKKNTTSRNTGELKTKNNKIKADVKHNERLISRVTRLSSRENARNEVANKEHNS